LPSVRDQRSARTEFESQVALARRPHGGAQVKELEWMGSAGPPPVVLENFVKLDRVAGENGMRITYYIDPIDDVIWRAEETRSNNCNWYISSGIR
jgi:hypothetical protein